MKRNGAHRQPPERNLPFVDSKSDLQTAVLLRRAGEHVRVMVDRRMRPAVNEWCRELGFCCQTDGSSGSPSGREIILEIWRKMKAKPVLVDDLDGLRAAEQLAREEGGFMEIAVPRGMVREVLEATELPGSKHLRMADGNWVFTVRPRAS